MCYRRKVRAAGLEKLAQEVREDHEARKRGNLGSFLLNAAYCRGAARVCLASV